MLRVTPLACAGLVVLLAGCEPSPVGPVNPGTPSNSWMNNPDNGNVRIARYTTGFAISWTDPTTGYRATHTTFPIGAEPDCGPQELLDPIEVQEVGTPDPDDYLSSWIHTNAKGDLWIIVRDLNTPGSCYGAALLAQGMGQLHLNDNDAIAWYPGSGRQNDNAFSYTAQGTLTGVDGKPAHYNGELHVVWDPQAGDPNTGKYIEHTQVNLK